MALPDCICVSGPLSEQLADIYCAARAWTDDASLPECVCVRGLPLGEQLTAIYEAIYTAAADDTLPDPTCIRGYPLGEQLTAIYQAILPLTADADLPSVLCIRGLPLFQQVDAIFCAALAVEVSPEFDPDAEAFFVAADITDETQKDAVNTLVVDLKAASLWDRFFVLYPFVGGAADPHSFNLVNPATFQITWNGGVLHDADGITGNGTTGFGNTGLSGVVAGHLCGLTVYIRDDAGVGNHRTIGISNTLSTIIYLVDRSEALGANRACLGAGAGLMSQVAAEAIGTVSANRTANNDAKFYDDAVEIGSYVVADASAAIAEEYYLLALNLEGSGAVSFCAANLALAAVHEGFTAAEVVTMTAIIQAFQTTLGRNV